MWLRSLVSFYCTSVKSVKMSKIPDPKKMLIREQVAASIAALTAEEKKRQSDIVYNKITNHPYYKSANRIAIFMSTDQEINTMPIISHIKAKGGKAFVPQYAGGQMRMLELEAGDEDNMPLTRHGIAQHSKDIQREDALSQGLDLIIAPGVAFTKNGGRLGHGGGYYDKYIANLRANPATAPKIFCSKGLIKLSKMYEVIYTARKKHPE
ncbi:5-formyltetrahydrofolate cyclo-ligase isoform X2 [Melitaea cinxia]|uniref:5-formyltetrahydrofolate cyclo-ligase isoform X2 n=1 Tax=Melitaea cinxia TaxID=113334 RepID=UPI001E274A0E|nr:5-formyltetrahydrofolate cyclo-ligase isoform X2 [Melitaea cinxia]